jgi:hypothetical protein
MRMTDNEPTVVTEFVLRGIPGRVLIHYGANDDPDRWGYPLLGMSYPVELAKGFPVIQAEVDYPAEGYAAVLAWIQLVWIRDLDGGKPNYQPVDLAPQLLGLDLPYFSFGVRPVLFDAPSYGIAANVDWVAHSMLVFTPDCLMTRVVRPVCGFSWGYHLRGTAPTLVPPQITAAPDWEPDLALLRNAHPSWVFENPDLNGDA